MSKKTQKRNLTKKNNKKRNFKNKKSNKKRNLRKQKGGGTELSFDLPNDLVEDIPVGTSITFKFPEDNQTNQVTISNYDSRYFSTTSATIPDKPEITHIVLGAVSNPQKQQTLTQEEYEEKKSPDGSVILYDRLEKKKIPFVPTGKKETSPKIDNSNTFEVTDHKIIFTSKNIY